MRLCCVLCYNRRERVRNRARAGGQEEKYGQEADTHPPPPKKKESRLYRKFVSVSKELVFSPPLHKQLNLLHVY